MKSKKIETPQQVKINPQKTSPKELQKILQRIQPGFAYSMLSLEIQIEMQQASDQPKIQSITSLIQMYMAAVQVLQSKSDSRYKYFSNKIQHLMKKKHVVQELHIVSTGRAADKSALTQVIKAEFGERKNQLDLQILLNRQQIDAKKIRQLVKTADNKIKTFQKNIQKNIKQQDQALQQRKRLRKLRSDAGSVNKFNFDRNFQSPSTKFAKTQKQLDDYFAIDKKQPKKRTTSIEKKDKQQLLVKSNQNSNKIRNYVI